MVMELSKKEKAIEQAQASLKIDKIYLGEEFLTSYRIRKGLPVKSGPKLVIKRGIYNASKR